MDFPFTFGQDPEHEAERLKAIKSYRIVNTLAEQAFDRIVELAKIIYNVPVVHISFIDQDQAFFKASIGLNNIAVINRDDSFCKHALLKPEVTVFDDTLKYPELADSPYIKTPYNIRFYAGAPIITHDGFIIGTMCVLDYVPRVLSDHEKEILLGLASVCMQQTELRLSTLENIEKQQQINLKLSQSEDRLQRILDTMAEGVGIVDESGSLVYINLMATQILGATEISTMGRNHKDPFWQNMRIDGSPLPYEEHPISIMLATAKAVHDCEISIQPTQNERVYISVNAAPMFNQAGKLVGGVVTFMDVTIRRKMLQQREEFISIASHELKTPVTSLKASMQIISRMKNNPSPVLLSTMIDRSNRSLHKLVSLINDLLNTSRIAQGQLNINKTNFNISNLINECCTNLIQIGMHKIILEGDPAMQVYADEQQIEQVLVNIINNATKYAANAKEIIVSLEKLEGQVKISIKDSGDGILAEKIPHLFDRYYRADYSGVQFSGLGLGLYICSEIIKKHGGQIGVYSKVGHGSTFWFTLPDS